MQIGNGFKVNSVVQYADFGQVNGEYIRDVPITGGGNSATINISLEEARQLVAGKTYSLSLTEQPEPETPAQPNN